MAIRLGLSLDKSSAPGLYIPPSTPIEVELAAIWSEILHREPIGIKDDFYSLGGDSLTLTSLLNTLETLPVATCLDAEEVVARVTVSIAGQGFAPACFQRCLS